MASYGWIPRVSAVARIVVSEDLQWFSLISAMRQTLANPPEPRRASATVTIQQNDKVRTQRDLVVGKRLIARGSIGTVTALHRRPLVEVAFFSDHPVSVTIAGYDLRRAVGA